MRCSTTDRGTDQSAKTLSSWGNLPDYCQAEQLCSIGSGAVKSAIKQIGARIKISGAQWNVESVI